MAATEGWGVGSHAASHSDAARASPGPGQYFHVAGPARGTRPAPRLVRLPHGARAGFVLAVSDVPFGTRPRAWRARLVEIRIGNGWLSLGIFDRADSYGGINESPFLAHVPKV